MITNAPIVLIVEDEKQIRRFVRVALEEEGFQVYEAGTVHQGLVEAGTRQPDIVILDLGLPDEDGIVFIRDLRSWSKLPIIILSARSDEANKIAALDAGADDYLTKPFGVGELLARVRVALRRRDRTQGDDISVVEFCGITVDMANRTVKRDQQPIHLTPIEYRLLMLLVRNAGRVMTHRQMLLEVWGPSHVEHAHYLRIYMSQLRQKLEKNPAQPCCLLTEAGVGFRLVID
ncbi:two-component system response regulator KdpE [Sulfuriferula nivalis]|uniref:DNA-binding response regulator n=1 Tax=Sulfuriferula nivalis TaxID=2675298 RepID=A0A809RID3_9PROT|nr:two-component system response regulator KdpE [Sulfuriferula nivalis]BBP00604.1 DNA-binding response regulator [Sulfuriferula nivalis]